MQIKKPAINLRERIAFLEAKVARLERDAKEQETFIFEPSASATTITLKQGWQPIRSYTNGVRDAEGSAYDYLVTFDGYLYTLTYAVAFGGTEVVQIDAERI